MSAELDARDLRRIRQWMECYPPGASVTVNRDLVLRLIDTVEAGRAIPPGVTP